MFTPFISRTPVWCSHWCAAAVSEFKCVAALLCLDGLGLIPLCPPALLLSLPDLLQVSLSLSRERRGGDIPFRAEFSEVFTPRVVWLWVSVFVLIFCGRKLL